MFTTSSNRRDQDIERWVASGLINVATGNALRAETRALQRDVVSFGSILMIMAALLCSAALLLLVAANWELFPRLLRVAALFAVLLGGYVGGAIARLQGHTALGDGLWLIGAAAFGGGIALIGQMYHISGDETQALLVWCLATGLAAAILRSGMLTVAAALGGASWMLACAAEFWRETPFPHLYLALVAGLWLVSIWTRSLASRHLLLVSVIVYVILFAINFDFIAASLGLAAASAAAFAVATLRPVSVERLVRLDGRLPVHALIAFYVSMLVVQAEHWDDRSVQMLCALVVFAATAAALLIAGRTSRTLRWTAYAGFGIELCVAYTATVGTMLGTASLFLASGVALAFLAFMIIRIERRVQLANEAAPGAA